jgi:hypothetical protein
MNNLQKASFFRPLLAVLTLTAFSFGSVPARVDSPGKTARGTLEVGEKKTPLDYAYAIPQHNGMILVLVSDQPLGEMEFKDVFERIHRAEAGQMHILEITLDPEKDPISVAIRHEAFAMQVGGGSTEDRFVPGKSDQNTFAGRFYRVSPGEFDGVKFIYDVTITAPIRKEPAASSSGAAAKNSPQADIAIAFLKAGRAGNAAAIKRTIVQSAVSDLDGPMGKHIIETMKMGPDPAKAKITRVDIIGTSAEVVFEEGSKDAKETTTIKLKLENGQWKVSPR